MVRPRTAGFTLIEIAIVLVIIGLLLTGIFMGRELITGARVRAVIRQQDEFKTAFFAFQDRFKWPPGDYPQASVNIAGVSDACGPGNGNGQIELASGEYILVWEHLSKARFLNNIYTCAGNNTVDAASVPQNPYGGFFQLIYDSNYAGAARDVHNLKTGSGMPSHIMAEIDRKIDDGNATLGPVRGSTYTTGAATDATCWDAATGLWIADPSSANCGGAQLY